MRIATFDALDTLTGMHDIYRCIHGDEITFDAVPEPGTPRRAVVVCTIGTVLPESTTLTVEILVGTDTRLFVTTLGKGDTLDLAADGASVAALTLVSTKEI